MLATLRLMNFRCYPTLRWEIPPEGAILLGDNAQGKTSLMEAMCFALTLHSPRATRLETLVSHGNSGFGISLDTNLGTRRLAWEARKLRLHVDGIPCRDYADYLADTPPVVWLSNRDISLVSGAAEERRKYLDFLGSQWHPHYRAALQAYRKALRARNMLLRNPRRTRAALQSYAGVMAQHGELLMQLRTQLLHLLQPHITQLHKQISGKEESVCITYTPSTTENLWNALDAATEADEKSGFTTIGPHRDDFQLMIAGAHAATFASEGQQRTLSTALLLAQSGFLREETGAPPVLFIDDIFGELDPGRRRALLNTLPPDGQTFITTTHLTWLRDTAIPLPVQKIVAGKIQ
ncbi:MAG: DNA replication and repair protein RecF [Akkermansia sp.]|nr:DNA replication and repair protein RecF [Akkermansia sp.]